MIDMKTKESTSFGGDGDGEDWGPELRGIQIPNVSLRGFQLEPDPSYYEDEIPLAGELPIIAGAVVIPGNIAFLNQFFEVMLLLTNNAPAGTALVVKDVTAEIVLPAGQDNIPKTQDDPLRIALTESGSQSVVPVLNAADKSVNIPAQASGEGMFLVEGVREGTHQLNIEIKGMLAGMPTGPIHVKGKATGTVLVRNPTFSLTFGHPNVVRAGEEYSLFVTVNNTSTSDANLVTLNLPPNEIFGVTMIADSDESTPLGSVRFRTIKAGDSAVAEFKLIARKSGRVTAASFAGDNGVTGAFNLRMGIGENGIPLSPDSLILSGYVKHLPQGLLYEAMRVLGLAHSVATAPVLPAGVTRIPKSVVAQRAYELTEAGLRVQMGEPLLDAICGLLADWHGDVLQNVGFDGILNTTTAGAAFLIEVGKTTGNVCAPPPTGGPRAISAMQLSEADAWDRGRVVAVLFDRKIKTESANNAANYRLVYRTLNRDVMNFPKAVKVLPGRRIVEIFFEGTVSPFFDYDLILSGIKGLSLQPQEPGPARVPVITTLTTPGGIVSGTVRRGDGATIPYTEVLVREKFLVSEDLWSASFSVNTMRTMTDAEGNYQLDFVPLGSEPFAIETSDPETGQKGSTSARILTDRQHLKLDILLLGLGTLTGRVVRAEDQGPVERAAVEVSSLTTSGTFGATTDAEGRFTIRMVPVGTLNVTATSVSHFGSVAAQIASPGTVADITIPVYAKDATGSVMGRVYEADGRTAVPGVPVIITQTGSGGGTKHSNMMHTDRLGDYVVQGVPSGPVEIKTFRQETGENAGATTHVAPGVTSTVNLVFPGTATLVGTVYDHKGMPVSGAWVVAGITFAVTDSNGNFTIERVSVGSVDVSSVLPGVSAEVTYLKVEVGSPGEVVRLNITLPSASTSRGTIQGYARSHDGQPLAYQTVFIWDGLTTPVIVATNNAGFFSKEMPLGGYTVRIVNGDLTDGDMKDAALFIGGQTVTVELKLRGFGRVTGTVFQPDGTSPTIADVLITKTAFTAIGTPYQKTERYVSDKPSAAGPNGKFTIDKVRVGEFRLEASNAFNSRPSKRAGLAHPVRPL